MSKIQIYFLVSKHWCAHGFSKRCKSSSRGLTTRSVSSRKAVRGDSYAEDYLRLIREQIPTETVGTDEQKQHRRHTKRDECAQQHKVQKGIFLTLKSVFSCVDVAVINKRKPLLPEEVLE